MLESQHRIEVQTRRRFDMKTSILDQRRTLLVIVGICAAVLIAALLSGCDTRDASDYPAPLKEWACRCDGETFDAGVCAATEDDAYDIIYKINCDTFWTCREYDWPYWKCDGDWRN
jgi:hypothetical protein